MVIIKGIRPRVSILPLVIVVTALVVLFRYSSLTPHYVDAAVDRAERNQSDVPRVFGEKKPPIELLQNEPSSLEDEPNVEHQPKEQVVKKPSSKPKRFCDRQSEADRGICIFDIGLNNGQDTVQYLEYSSEARVVAVEANPTLVNKATNRFGDAIADSRLKILNIGLVGNKTKGEESPKLEFWINKVNDLFSSFHQRTGCRDAVGNFLEEGDSTFCRKIEMQTKSCSELIKEYGTPLYMKIDIEGMDRKCLQSLGNIPHHNRPKYASIENVNVYDIDIFTRLGYRGFKVVNQNNLQVNLTSKDLDGHSGPWGEDAQDFWIGKEWHTGEDIVAHLPLPTSISVRGKNVTGWYDLHARMLYGHDGTQAGFEISEYRAKLASGELTSGFRMQSFRLLYQQLSKVIILCDALHTGCDVISLRVYDTTRTVHGGLGLGKKLRLPSYGGPTGSRTLKCWEEREFTDRAVTQPYLG